MTVRPIFSKSTGLRFLKNKREDSSAAVLTLPSLIQVIRSLPERVERIHWLREVKDVTQILYQIAVTAGVLIVAF
ncbi:MAG: hypothetical protein MPW14_00005 [Candidatus Manganitrophus sp.]|nr:MAG: hypothetical protein MPW14_00005 [Candidatus Manganitrophus sp.]